MEGRGTGGTPRLPCGHGGGVGAGKDRGEGFGYWGFGAGASGVEKEEDLEERGWDFDIRICLLPFVLEGRWPEKKEWSEMDRFIRLAILIIYLHCSLAALFPSSSFFLRTFAGNLK